MKEKELSQDINFWGLLEETLLLLVFWGSLKEKSADDPFSFIELFFSPCAVKFIGIEKLQVKTTTTTKTTQKNVLASSTLKKFSVKSVTHLWKRDISLGLCCYELFIKNILIKQMTVYQALCAKCSTCCVSFNPHENLIL